MPGAEVGAIAGSDGGIAVVEAMAAAAVAAMAT